MKLYFTIIAFIVLFIGSLQAQKTTLGFDFGAGSSYMGENFEKDNNIEYKPGYTAMVNLKYQPKEAYFGIRFNYQYVCTAYNLSYVSYNDIAGDVSTSTTSLFLERLNRDKKWKMGYFFGLGVTRESVATYKNFEQFSTITNFMSLSAGGVLSYNMSENSALRLTPSVLWTDPINTFRTDNWYRAREDVSAFISLGYAYSF